jgi:hypothetical protein
MDCFREFYSINQKAISQPKQTLSKILYIYILHKLSVGIILKWKNSFLLQFWILGAQEILINWWSDMAWRNALLT